VKVSASDVTVAIGLSRGYRHHLKACLATLPAEIPKIVSWVGPGAPEEVPRHTRVVTPKLYGDNFRRGYVQNVAIRAVDTPYVLLSDADHLFPSFLFDVVKPRPDRVLRFYAARMTREATRKVLQGEDWETLFADYQGLHGQVFTTVYGGHNPCLYPTEALKQVRGYDERMIGWGKEDDDLTQRTRRHGLRDVRVPLLVGCMWDAEASDYPTYRRGQPEQQNVDILASPRPIAANPLGWGDVEDALSEE